MTQITNTNFEKSLNELFLILSYNTITTQSVLNKIAFVLSSYIPVNGIVLSSFYNKTVYRIASVGCLENIFVSYGNVQFDDELLEEFSNNPRHISEEVLYFSTDQPYLSKLISRVYRPGVNSIYIPFGPFLYFPGYCYMNIFFTKGPQNFQDYVHCCEWFRPALTFFTSVILRNENWRIQDGQLVSGASPKNLGFGAPTSGKLFNSEFKSLEDVNREHIQKALQLTGGRVAGKYGAATKLGLKPTTLWAKIRKYGIEIPKSGNDHDEGSDAS